MRIDQCFCYDNLVEALAQFVPTLQGARHTIILSVYRSHFTLGFDVDSKAKETGITSATCLSPIDNVAGRLFWSARD